MNLKLCNKVFSYRNLWLEEVLFRGRPTGDQNFSAQEMTPWNFNELLKNKYFNNY